MPIDCLVELTNRKNRDNQTKKIASSTSSASDGWGVTKDMRHAGYAPRSGVNCHLRPVGRCRRLMAAPSGTAVGDHRRLLLQSWETDPARSDDCG
jgi:hypothetical protein